MTYGFMMNTPIDRLIDRHGLVRIFRSYYYLQIKDSVEYNFLFITAGVSKNHTIEPVEFMDMLSELSPFVAIGNTFTDVAICLGLPDRMKYSAQELDRAMAQAVT